MATPTQRKHQFGIAGLLKCFLLISAIMAAMFVPSDIVFLIAMLLGIGTVIRICIGSRVHPAGCGAAVGFVPPALIALRFIGEIYWPREPGVYAETEDNLFLAAVTIVFVGSLGVLLGSALGTIVAMVYDWSDVED